MFISVAASMSLVAVIPGMTDNSMAYLAGLSECSAPMPASTSNARTNIASSRIPASSEVSQPPNAESDHERTEQETENNSSREGIAGENPETSRPTFHSNSNNGAEDCGTPQDSQEKLKKKILSVLRSKPFIIGSGAVLGTIGAVALAPLAVGALGFTAAGIQAGSIAASMMSSLGGAATASGSVVAVLQSVGATGTVLGSVAAAGTSAAAGAVAGTAVSGVATVIADKVDSNSGNLPSADSENQGNGTGSVDQSAPDATVPSAVVVNGNETNANSSAVLIDITCEICGKVISRAAPAFAGTEDSISGSVTNDNASHENREGNLEAGAAITARPNTCDNCSVMFDRLVGFFVSEEDLSMIDTNPSIS